MVNVKVGIGGGGIADVGGTLEGLEQKPDLLIDFGGIDVGVLAGGIDGRLVGLIVDCEQGTIADGPAVVIAWALCHAATVAEAIAGGDPGAQVSQNGDVLLDDDDDRDALDVYVELLCETYRKSPSSRLVVNAMVCSSWISPTPSFGLCALSWRLR